MARGTRELDVLNGACPMVTVAVLWFLLSVACRAATPVVIPVTLPARVDMDRFSGLYFPGFAMTDAEANGTLVRALQRAFRVRGYVVVQGELSTFRPGTRFPWGDFDGQSALVITGELAFMPLKSEGFRTRTREQFDPYGRRMVEAGRRYEQQEGYTLRGLLVFIDRGKPFLRLTDLHASRMESREWGGVTREMALVGFVESDLEPAVLRMIAPTTIRARRMLIQDAPAWD